MQLYLVRHAIADERGPRWPDDSVRPLTPSGIERFERAVAGLASLGVTLDAVVTSPFRRAVQTAEILAAGVPGGPSIHVEGELAPGHALDGVVACIARRSRGRRIAVVGHQPDLGTLGACLIRAHTALDFKKGGMCRIDFASAVKAGAGTLVWLATPRMLRRLRPSR